MEARPQGLPWGDACRRDLPDQAIAATGQREARPHLDIHT
jgi:hypothetical protein